MHVCAGIRCIMLHALWGVTCAMSASARGREAAWELGQAMEVNKAPRQGRLCTGALCDVCKMWFVQGYAQRNRKSAVLQEIRTRDPLKKSRFFSSVSSISVPAGEVWRRFRRTLKEPQAREEEEQKDRSSRRVRRWSPNPLLVTPKAALLPGADENGHFQPGMNDPCKARVL